MRAEKNFFVMDDILLSFLSKPQSSKYPIRSGLLLRTYNFDARKSAAERKGVSG
jgi:hypothetical protein